jgi:muramoyltetrapeptide carboxypeptidase
VVIFIDPPTWPGHGRFWSHMISDTSYAELHAFAATVGIPPRAFERDHYDVIAERYEAVVAAGAHRATSREIVAMLHRAGLRRRHRSALAPPLGRAWPRALVRGDLVAVVAPSGPVAPDRLARGVALLESWGLRVRLQPRVLGTYEPLTYLAADDHGRADDLTAAWTDPTVAAVWAARGGYGAQRMVDLVDWSAVRAAGRKTFVGFSDITALHCRLGRDLEQVTVHGPVLGSAGQLDDTESVAALRTLIMERPGPGTVLVEGRSAVPGVGHGRLVGGNLSLIAADVGVEPPPEVSAIAVFEDIGEDGYRIDRMLTQLLRSRWFDQVTGVVVGEFSPVAGAAPTSSGLAAAVITDRLERLSIPVLTDVAVGHGPRNLALPLGAAVTLAVGPPGTPGTLALAAP